MKRERKIYHQALNSPANITFNDLCYLVERIGFELRPGAGSSHLIYKHRGIHEKGASMLNIQIA
ncbi:MAG: hypothetical protein HQL20_08860, partial [Candidatus Omnitrophica bacterium]|nr:hypothetical protein [Candidatus Omnitrophota bacterium]